MIAVLGADGQTGGVTARRLLALGRPVRVVLRRDARAAAWRAAGAEVAIADAGDAASLTRALSGCERAYLMNPPAYRVPDMFAAAQATHRALVDAANVAGLDRIVALSSVGAQRDRGTGNILTTHDFEAALDGATSRVSILRAANFIENFAASVEPVRARGVLPSMFLPLDRAVPMVSVADIGTTAADLLVEDDPPPLVELQGPAPVSPVDAAAAFGRLLGRTVTAVEVPRGDWAAVFERAGFAPAVAVAFCEMYDGFNAGWTVFEGTHARRVGQVGLDDALRALLR